ncbi:hypothetical protein [Burkholderia multivorans]|uniref:hypothetical protein n=1 Tax=Burkholderia multivorans TaxID=87883 RepID=UPI000CFE8842|nr:hypothetical protein [Burkholderia multivorans]PRG26125.1 hypothetical protein C6Q35_06210 [Burkholderia multivorans]
MTFRDKDIWFPAKRYGLGIARRMARVVLLYAIGVVATARLLKPDRPPVGFGTCVVALVTLLTAMCWITGEWPPSRQGKGN